MRADDAWSQLKARVIALAKNHPDARVTAVIDTYGLCSIAVNKVKGSPVSAAKAVFTADPALERWAASAPVLPYRAEQDDPQKKDSLLRLALEGAHAQPLEPAVPNAFIVSRTMSNESWGQSIDQNPARWPKVVGFYSFKGGVGRSTAAAITALLMAREGRRILLVDLDLEAPGLEGYFGFTNDQVQGGMVDLLLEQAAMGSRWTNNPLDHLLPYVDDLEVQNRGGLLHIVPAGRLNKSYPERLGRLALADMARAPGDQNPLRIVLQGFLDREEYDLIFVDCRTGFSEVGGMALNGLSDLNVLMFKTAQSEQRYVEVVLDHIARLSAARLSNAGAQEVSRLANSLLFVFSMAQLPAEPREAKEFVDELRGRVSGLLWERVFEHLAPGIWIQPALDAEDSPDDPVPHDVVVVPYLRDLPALSRASDMLYKATEVGVKAYESLARRMLDVKLRLPTPVTDPAEPPSTVAGDVVTALASLITNVDGERELSSAQHLKDRFLPRAAHRGLLSADVLIIQGEKGAGKSALFMAFQDREFLLQLARYAGVAANQQERLTRTDLMVGFEAGMNSALSQPVVSLFATFQAESWRDVHETLRGFWRGLLCAQLIIHRHDFTVPGDAPLPPLTVIPTVTNAHTLSLSPERQTELILWLQEVMRRAKAKNKQLWVLYDGLDAHLTSAPQRRGPLISALVDLWWDLRGQPISARIFLRQDLWDREVSLVDKAKIISGTYRVQLEWDAEELYRLLIKRLLVAESFQQLLREHKLWRDDLNPRPGLDRLGLVPPSDEAWLQDVVAALVGEHMGVGSKKGGTYTWIVKHLGDANGRVRPRSLLTLFALAATKQGADLKGRAPLDQARLREALRTGVSPQGVAELKQEFALEWMSGDVWVPDTFKEHETLWPVDYEPLKRFLSKRLKLPVSRVSELLYQMAVSGLLEHRTTKTADKIQVPDIYLYGLGLTRKG